MSLKRYAAAALSLSFLWFLLGLVFWPALLLIPFTLLSIVVYPVVRDVMPGAPRKR